MAAKVDGALLPTERIQPVFYTKIFCVKNRLNTILMNIFLITQIDLCNHYSIHVYRYSNESRGRSGGTATSNLEMTFTRCCGPGAGLVVGMGTREVEVHAHDVEHELELVDVFRHPARHRTEATMAARSLARDFSL